MNFVKSSLLFAVVVVLSLSGSTVFAQMASGAAVANAVQANAITTPRVNPSVTTAQPIQHQQVITSRSQIRSMPITQRPNRPGHFIGNTVRRRASR